MINANSAPHRFNTTLLLWFGVCAAILAAGGVYSVVLELIAVREHEITIKIALGAQRPRLARETVSGTLAWVFCGEILGALGAYAITRIAADLFFAGGSSGGRLGSGSRLRAVLVCRRLARLARLACG